MSRKIGIFCGANKGFSEKIVEQSIELSYLLADAGYDLVYGGGNRGLMGIIADCFLEKGRTVTGIRPEKLIVDEALHTNITETIVVEDMFERKSKLLAMSDAFIALPGGVGTLDEIIDAFTHLKIGFINKPCSVLNTDNFYEGLNLLFDSMVKNGFLKEADRKKLIIEDTPVALVVALNKEFLACY